jgi:actin-like ATPase involved in cell morphogenesis
MPYALGIDVGTTFTAAAAWRENRVEVIALETHRVTVPTVVFAERDELAFGATAVARGAAQPAGIGREFKRRLGDPVPVMLSGAPYSADRLVALFARWVVDTVTEQLGEPPSAVVVTHPANWTDFQLHLLRNSLDQVGLGDSGLLSEPQAAAHDFGAAAHLGVGDLVLVYDLGGGTFDVALLRREERGFSHVGEPAGVERLGGIDFDEAVFHHVVAHLPPGVTTQASADPAGRMALTQLRRSSVEAKETLSSEVAVDIPVVLPGHSSTVRLTRPELEAMVRPMLGQTIDLARRVLTSAGRSTDDLSAILLVGGSSRIPLVSELVRDELGVAVRVDAHPKLVVARGAARWAGTLPLPTGSSAAAGAEPSRWRRGVLVAAGAAALLALGGGVWYAAAGGDDGSGAEATTPPASTGVEATEPTAAGTTATTPVATEASAVPTSATASTAPPSTTSPITTTAPTVPALPPAVSVQNVVNVGTAELPPGTSVDDHAAESMAALSSQPGTNQLVAISDDSADLEAAAFAMVVDLSSGALETGDIHLESAMTLVDSDDAPYGSELSVEATTRTEDGTIVISSQGAAADDVQREGRDPFIHELDGDGRFIRAWPIPDWYLPDPDRVTGMRPEGGLSSLTTLRGATPQVLAAFGYTLYQDEESPEYGGGKHVRILAYDATAAEPAAEYWYPLDDTHLELQGDREPEPSALLDLEAIDGTSTLIAVERSWLEAPHRARLYEVSLDPDAAAAPSPEGPSRALEKRFLAEVDLDDPPARRGNWRSIAEGPRVPDGRRTVILVRNNSNNPGQSTWFRAFAFETTPTD